MMSDSGPLFFGVNFSNICCPMLFAVCYTNAFASVVQKRRNDRQGGWQLLTFVQTVLPLNVKPCHVTRLCQIMSDGLGCSTPVS